MNEQELAEYRAANRQLSDVLNRLVRVARTRQLDPDRGNAGLYRRAFKDLWAQHRDASIRLSVLSGLSPRYAELLWRDQQTYFLPNEVLNAAERRELEAFKAEQDARRKELDERRSRTLEAIRQLERHEAELKSIVERDSSTRGRTES